MDQEIAVTVDADPSFTLPPDVAQEDPADLIRKQLEDSNAALEAEKRQRAVPRLPVRKRIVALLRRLLRLRRLGLR